jgi:Uncharacterized protein conserved in bacteria (DUF2188)
MKWARFIVTSHLREHARGTVLATTMFMPSQQSTAERPLMSYRVVPIDGVWKVALPGDSIAASFHARKEDAIANALRLARKDGANVLVCSSDGTVETELSTSHLS